MIQNKLFPDDLFLSGGRHTGTTKVKALPCKSRSLIFSNANNVLSLDVVQTLYSYLLYLPASCDIKIHKAIMNNYDKFLTTGNEQVHV